MEDKVQGKFDVPMVLCGFLLFVLRKFKSMKASLQPSHLVRSQLLAAAATFLGLFVPKKLEVNAEQRHGEMARKLAHHRFIKNDSKRCVEESGKMISQHKPFQKGQAAEVVQARITPIKL